MSAHPKSGRVSPHGIRVKTKNAAPDGNAASGDDGNAGSGDPAYKAARPIPVGRVPSRGGSPEGAKEGGELPTGWEWKTVGGMVEAMQYGTSAKTSDDDSGVPVLRMGNLKNVGRVPSHGESEGLPKGWRRVAIKDMADSIQYGHTASAVDRKDGPRFLRITDIQDGRVDWSAVPSCDIPKADVPKYRLSSGDLVFARTGATTGKSFLIGECPEAVFASYLIRVRVSSGVDSRYLSAFFQSPDYWRQIEGGKRGIGQPNVNGQVLGEVQFPIAPLPEQRRIVAEIEKQFTRLEAGVAALRRVQASLKRYRAAVLKAACEGRLVPTEVELSRVGRVPPRGGRVKGKGNAASGDAAYNDAPFESGEALLARILTERRQNWQGRGKYKEPAAPDTANLPPLPEGWTWVQFGHLGKDPFNTVQTGPFGAQLHNTEFTETGVPVIAVGNLTGTGFRTNGLYYVNATKAKQLARYDVWAGDLLFARSGATLGKVCVAPAVVQDWRMTGHILRARLNPNFINPKIAVYALAALPAVRKQVLGSVRGVTRPGFNTGLLESIFIPVPPLAEQTRIVAEVERRLSVVEELESVVSANLQRATRLRQSILQRAFTGELV